MKRKVKQIHVGGTTGWDVWDQAPGPWGPNGTQQAEQPSVQVDGGGDGGWREREWSTKAD